MLSCNIDDSGNVQVMLEGDIELNAKLTLALISNIYEKIKAGNGESVAELYFLIIFHGIEQAVKSKEKIKEDLNKRVKEIEDLNILLNSKE